MVKQLMASGLWFGQVIKKVEIFWDVGTRLVCVKCCGISYKQLNICGNRPKKCKMCIGEYKANEH